MIVIGLSGKIGVGKTSVATCLVDVLNEALNRQAGVRLSFADELRREAAEVYGFAPSLALTQDGKRAMVQHPDLPGGLGTVRDVLIHHGQQRRQESPGYWVARLEARLDECAAAGAMLAVVDDVRFVDELEALRRRGAALVRVLPHGAWQPGAHAHDVSETALDGREDWAGWVRPDYGPAGVDAAARRILAAAMNLVPLTGGSCES